MALHEVSFDYKIKEGSAMDIDLDISADLEERHAEAIAAIREVYPDIEDIKITGVELING